MEAFAGKIEKVTFWPDQLPEKIIITFKKLHNRTDFNMLLLGSSKKCSLNNKNVKYVYIYGSTTITSGYKVDKN